MASLLALSGCTVQNGQSTEMSKVQANKISNEMSAYNKNANGNFIRNARVDRKTNTYVASISPQDTKLLEQKKAPKNQKAHDKWARAVLMRSVITQEVKKVALDVHDNKLSWINHNANSVSQALIDKDSISAMTGNPHYPAPNSNVSKHWQQTINNVLNKYFQVERSRENNQQRQSQVNQLNNQLKQDPMVKSVN